jgi:hypothetical protein
MKNKLLILFFIFINYTISFSNDYPWDSIKSVSISTKMDFDGLHLRMKKHCACNCEKDSNLVCNFRSFQADAFDYDLCFWKDLLNNSKPDFVEGGFTDCSFCGEEPFQIEIQIITNLPDTLKCYLLSSSPEHISFSTHNGRWDFTIRAKLTNQLNDRLEKILNCGIESVMNFKNSHKLGSTFDKPKSK